MRRLLLLGCILLAFSCTAQDSTHEADTSTVIETGGQNEVASDPEHLQSGPVSPLAAGLLPHGSGAALGREVTFRNGSEKTTCLSLEVEGNRLGWIHKAHRTPSELLLWQCIPFDDMPKGTAGQVEGVADHETVYIIERTEKGWGLKAHQVPGFWFQSNESFCGERVAYWAYRNGEHATAVYDYAKNSVLFHKSMGSFTIYSNDPEYFPRPEWDDKCSTVVFPKNYFLKEPETVRLD